MPLSGPNACSNDGGAAISINGLSGNCLIDDGNGNGSANGNCLPFKRDFLIDNGAANGTATGTGNMIGDFFKLCKILAALAIFATFNALAALIPAIFRASVFLATRNGAVMALNTANLVAFAYGSE